MCFRTRSSADEVVVIRLSITDVCVHVCERVRERERDTCTNRLCRWLWDLWWVGAQTADASTDYRACRETEKREAGFSSLWA